MRLAGESMKALNQEQCTEPNCDACGRWSRILMDGMCKQCTEKFHQDSEISEQIAETIRMADEYAAQGNP